jgi:hypothetical protein
MVVDGVFTRDATAAAREDYANYTSRLERALTALVRRGQESGELARTADAPSVARMLGALRSATRARQCVRANSIPALTSAIA